VQEKDEEGNVLDEYFMGIEEQEHIGPAKKDRGPVFEEDNPNPIHLLSKRTTVAW